MIVKTCIFNRHDRQYWIKSINSLRKNIAPNKKNERGKIQIRIIGSVTKENFGPVHIVLLACFVEYLDRLNYNIFFETQDADLLDFIFGVLKMDKYFNGNKTEHIEAKNSSILNLWKVVNNRAEEYSLSVTAYFQRYYFKGYDLTGLKNSLDEIFYNIGDHSQSNGNAFSYISYDEKECKIHVAACDFGLGIPCTLKAAGNIYENDTAALRQSLEIGVSAKTHKHNRGFGLDNIVSNLSNGGMLRIVSNKGLLFCMNEKSNIKLYPLSFDFEGTLMYFDICINSLEVEEMFNDATI